MTSVSQTQTLAAPETAAGPLNRAGREPAVSGGATRWGSSAWVCASDDALVFLRESPEEVALVHCARAAHEPVTFSTRNLPGISGAHTTYRRDLSEGNGTAVFDANGPQVGIWTWRMRA